MCGKVGMRGNEISLSLIERKQLTQQMWAVIAYQGPDHVAVRVVLINPTFTNQRSEPSITGVKEIAIEQLAMSAGGGAY